MKTSQIDWSAPHRRFNALMGEWVLVSPHRTKRPWQGEKESQVQKDRASYVADCYLCPDNERANGRMNPHYSEPYVFTNDFSALLPDTPEAMADDDLLRAESAHGVSRVVCFSSNHSLTLPQMTIPEITKVVQVWKSESADLGETYRWVQIFENKGDIMGCSNNHPHGQIWASQALPTIPAREDAEQKSYLAKHKRPMLIDYRERERELGERVVEENEHWVVLVPFWAIWPYEILLLPKRDVSRIIDLNLDEEVALAQILKSMLERYDRVFDVPFPYTMGWHGAPFDGGANSHWLLHAHAYPPLLRSANVKKFMVGYEMLSEPQRDINAEQAAETLRALGQSPPLKTSRP